MKLLLIFLFVFLISEDEFVGVSADNTKKGHNTRIVGGEQATISQFPFAAAIDVQTTNNTFFCGGSLFTQQWIITAGQCVNGAILFTIRLGSASLDNNDATLVTVATSDYVLHPDFNPDTLENDIGLIKLRLPVGYTDYIRPVSLLAVNDLAVQSGLRAIGWGQINDATVTLSNELNYVYVASLPNAQCRIRFGDQIKDTMVCVEGDYNQGACHGDTGSPLLEAWGNNETSVHVGISSFVSGNGCESIDPSGYTRTYPYVNWIYTVVYTY